MWTPITKIELQDHINKEKDNLNENELSFFQKIEIPLESINIDRSGNIENVYIVAKYKNDTIFFDDVEEGFEITQIDNSGLIKDYGANQFELKYVVNQLLNENT